MSESSRSTQSAEDILQYWLLIEYNGYRPSKQRIYDFVVENHPVKTTDFIPFLKNLYDIGGARGELGNNLFGYMHDGKNIQLSWEDEAGLKCATDPGAKS